MGLFHCTLDQNKTAFIFTCIIICQLVTSRVDICHFIARYACEETAYCLKLYYHIALCDLAHLDELPVLLHIKIRWQLLMWGKGNLQLPRKIEHAFQLYMYLLRFIGKWQYMGKTTSVTFLMALWLSSTGSVPILQLQRIFQTHSQIQSPLYKALGLTEYYFVYLHPRSYWILLW